METKSCPYCGSNVVDVEQELRQYFKKKWWGVCDTCLARGPVKDTHEAATAAWNKTAERREALEKISAIVEDAYQPALEGTKKEKSVNAVIRLHYILEDILKESE